MRQNHVIIEPIHPEARVILTTERGTWCLDARAWDETQGAAAAVPGKPDTHRRSRTEATSLSRLEEIGFIWTPAEARRLH